MYILDFRFKKKLWHFVCSLQLVGFKFFITFTFSVIHPSHWREAKKSNREEKEKFDILFSNFEKRKRNLKFISPVSRGEKEIWKKVLHFREEKEKGIFFSQVSRGERESFLKSPISRREREIWNSFPQFWEEKEKFGKGFSTFEKRKRNGYYFLNIREEKENSYQAFWKVFPFSEALPIILWQPKL